MDILERYCTLNGGNQAEIENCQIVSKLRYLRQYYYRKGRLEDAVSAGRRVLRWSSDQTDLREFVNCCEAGVSSLKYNLMNRKPLRIHFGVLLVTVETLRTG